MSSSMLSSTTSQTKIFFMGATGYIGGSVLNRLLSHPEASTFAITALVRSPSKASKLEAIGVNTVIGSLKDDALIESLAAAADAVISTADCDDDDIAKAYLKGMKRHFEETGKVPILIHTSGTGVLADRSAGYFRDVPVYIVLPSMIYGLASGRLVDLGIQNKFSSQVPQLIKAALGRGQAGMVGAGTNKWGAVHIDDVTDLYVLLFDLGRTDPDAIGHGREGFYFGINGECTLGEIGQAIGEKLVAIGRATTPEPTTFTEEEIKAYFRGSTFWGTNSRGVANRSHSIGWNPRKTEKDLLASVGPEVEAILKERSG
ncbi:hypothetical protein D9613_011878 [Agrocybe pediades]|uniref:NAD(P)-binding domain-containing protein n=1 Tax=Agrocybe pediades TaxID=84607 RepID=A0A8H4VKA3_9AGAR|nr:hypothetical protein D9613_011878 [Agrocybe pediades]